MNSVEPVTFDEFLYFTLESMATRTLQGLKVMQQYLNFMHIFRYDSNDKWWLWNRNKEGQLEMAL